MSETVLHVQIDQAVEMRAQEAFAAMGLTLDQAVRAFLEQAADNQRPLQMSTPNALTRAAIERTRAKVLRRARDAAAADDARAGE